MHDMDADKAYEELHKTATSNIGQILEAASHETAVVRTPTTHLEAHPN